MKDRISNEETASLCLELSLLLHAGVSLGDALTLLSEEEENPLLSGLAERVDMGAPLSEALRESAQGAQSRRWARCPGTTRSGRAWAGACAAHCCTPRCCWA